MNPEQQGTSASDRAAIERYRYLVQTAPPEAIERAHEEAFARLTPEQRRQALQQLSAAVPAHERPSGNAEDPRSLARLATRAEVREPGTLARTLGGGGQFAGSLLSSLAGAFIGTAIAQQLWGGLSTPEDASGEGGGAEEEPPAQEAAGEDGSEQDANDLADGYGDELGDDLGTGI